MTNKVLIIGYYGAGYAADEAVLEGMLDDLRARIPALHPVVISADPDSTSRTRKVESISNSERSTVLAAVKDCDFIILGCGGLLKDFWDVSLATLFTRSGTTLNYYSYAALAALYAKPPIGGKMKGAD